MQSSLNVVMAKLGIIVKKNNKRNFDKVRKNLHDNEEEIGNKWVPLPHSPLDFEFFAGLTIKINGRGCTSEKEFHPLHKLFVHNNLGHC